MVAHTQSSSSFRDGSHDTMDQAWSYDSAGVGTYPSTSYVSTMQFSDESYDSIDKETISDGTPSTHFDEASSCYSTSELSSKVNDPPKLQEPTPTVFVLQHHIRPTEEVASREERETERAEPKKEARSFTLFSKHFGKNKKETCVESTSRVPPPNETNEVEARSSEKTPSESKPSLRGKGFLPAKRRSSESFVEEEPLSSSVPQLDVVSLTDSDEDDDREESIDGGSMNTNESDMMNSTYEGEENRRSRSMGSTRRRPSFSKEASTAAATGEAPSRSFAYGDSTPLAAADEEKSVKSNKSSRSNKSGWSNKSKRSLSRIFKRKSRDDHSRADMSEAEEEDTRDDRKFKKKRGWLKILPFRSRSSKGKSKLSKSQKGILRKKSNVDNEPETLLISTSQQPSGWEALLDGCDTLCCRPLFGKDAYEETSVYGESIEAPSEIYVSNVSSKMLVTV